MSGSGNRQGGWEMLYNYRMKNKPLKVIDARKRFYIFAKSHTVHLKPGGEICNRLKAGTKIYLHQIKGEWKNISWRNGKKKGWVKL